MNLSELFVYLRVHDPQQAIAFYETVFGAKEKFRLVEPSGRIGHVELDFGCTTVMLSAEFPELGILSPRAIGGAGVTIHLHVDDADQLIAKALAQGATLVRPAADHFYGERSGTVRDPFGYEWSIGHELERLSPEEMQRRYTALFS
ncbi:MAG: VOC family protein [Myxococcota bacterium]